MTAHRSLRAVLASAAAALAVLTATPAAAAANPVPVPADGTSYFGVHLDWGNDGPAAYATRSGLRPASYGYFTGFPMSATEKSSLDAVVNTLVAQQSALFLTVEPFGGLSAVTDQAVADLAATMSAYNSRGVPVFLRFAHEMNGSWYAWGQQPSAYVAAFRRVAAAVHAAAPVTAMVWAPNYGGGYPFTGGTYAAAPGSADYRTLDTDASGSVTMADDPYAPYYPGDDAVDWAGLTLYHFGNAYPWQENETPEPGKFGQFLTGTYNGNGLYEDQTAVPDFYAGFATARGKPLAIAETSALYNESPPKPGDSAYAIKNAWLQQVYATATRDRFPLVKLVNWFEIRKYEAEARGVVDWRVTADPALREQLLALVGTSRYVFAAGSQPPAPTDPTVPTPPGAPTGVTASSMPGRVTLSWTAPAPKPGGTVTGYVACLSNVCRTLPASATSTLFIDVARKVSLKYSLHALNGDLAARP